MFPYSLHFALADKHGSVDILSVEFRKEITRRDIYHVIETVQKGTIIPFSETRSIREPLSNVVSSLSGNVNVADITHDTEDMDDDLFRDWFREEVTLRVTVQKNGERVCDAVINEDDDENNISIRYLTKVLFF
jgi:S-adenosylmethionine:tRNA-ribosyltransferase-isomerase (queuine synthetase)